ncbi:MAG: hypothetical protein ACRDFZ_05985 [Candidatus Limnocylindria bacterium]
MTSMRSRALTIAIVIIVVLFVGAVAALAIAGGQSLTDPAEILTRGAEATSDADSFHMALTVTGTITDPDTGANMPLDGVSVEGDIDLAGEAAHVTFAVPFLLGLSGEAIVLGEDVYVLSSLTGDKWVHTPAPSESSPSPEPTSSAEIADKVAEFLATEGVSAEKLADAECGEDTCYHIQLTISEEALAAHPDAMPDMGEYGSFLPDDPFSGPVVVDLLFDRDGLWLRQVSTTAADPESDGPSLTLTLSDYNQSFDISAPPADEVTEEGEFPLFP